jgi:hypothetical protein
MVEQARLGQQGLPDRQAQLDPQVVMVTMVALDRQVQLDPPDQQETQVVMVLLAQLDQRGRQVVRQVLEHQQQALDQ